jgi:putative flippase GtrA
MQVYIKVQVASVLGSVVDYGTTILLAEIFHWPYLISNLMGNMLGGLGQFNLCKFWVFRNSKSRTPVQALRFILAFIGNLILSAAGVYLFTHFIGLNYIVSKTITSIGLGLSYNYWVQKKFVFS